MMNRRIVENAKDRRLYTGLPLRTVAKLAEVSRPTLAKVERGEPVTLTVAAAIERALTEIEG